MITTTVLRSFSWHLLASKKSSAESLSTPAKGSMTCWLAPLGQIWEKISGVSGGTAVSSEAAVFVGRGHQFDSAQRFFTRQA